LINLKILL